MDPWPRTSIQINMEYAPLSSSTDSFYAHPTVNGITSNENIRSDHIDREIAQRKAEKHQIRKEIIALELASRRALEARVRREILLEGELKLQRPEPLPLPLPSSSSSSSSSTLMHCCYGGYDQGRLDETMPSQSLYDSGAFNRFSYKKSSEGELKLQRPEPLPLPLPLPSSSSSSSSSSSTLMHCCYGGYDQGRLDETMPSQSLYNSGAFNRFSYKKSSEAAVNEVEPPFQRLRNYDGKSSATGPDIKGIPSVSSGKLLVLPKVFHTNLSGTKRKETEAAMAEPNNMPSFVNKKKKKLQSQHKEWSCTLCQVSATSEQGLRDHLRGKKHKAKKRKRMKGKKTKPRKFKGISKKTTKQLQDC